MKSFGNKPSAVGVLCLVAMTAVAINAAPQQAEIPSLEKLPKVDRLWLGIEEGVIRPASYEQLLSEVDQWVEIHVPTGTRLKKGQHWATLSPQTLDLEKRSHDLEDIKAERDLEKELAKLEDERIQLVLAQQEAMANLEGLKLAAKDASLPVELRRRSEEMADKLKQKIGLMDKQLKPEAIEAQRELTRKDAALRKERRDKILEDLENRSVIVAGSEGTLVLSEPVLEALKEAAKHDDKGSSWVRIKANELVGLVRNDDYLELWVNAQGPLLADLPQQRLTVRVQDPRTGALLSASHVRTEEKESGAEIKRTYVFRIDERDSEKAGNSIGVRSMVHVYVMFEKPCRMVFKKDIAHIDPVLLEKAGWVGLVQRIWPSSKVVQVGPQTIAIHNPNED